MIRISVALLVCGALLGGCAERSRPAPDTTGAPSPASSPAATPAAIEPGVAPAPPDSIGRLRGDTLALRLTTGRYVQLVNSNGPTGEPDRAYTYRGVLEGGAYYVVDVHYYESGGVVLVDRTTGAVTETVDRPLVSPSGRLGVAAAYDLEIGEGANEIQLWRLLPRPATLVWSMPTPGDRAGAWGASVDRWIGDSIVMMTRHERVENAPERQVPMRLVKRDTTWMIDTIPR